MKLTRPNRGNRLRELLEDGFSDEDDITDEWKEADDDGDASIGSSSDRADSDFSASEHTSTLSGESHRSWSSDTRRGKPKAGKVVVRKRRAPTIPQQQRLRAALDRAAQPAPVEMLDVDKRPAIRPKSSKIVAFYSGRRFASSHVVGSNLA